MNRANQSKPKATDVALPSGKIQIGGMWQEAVSGNRFEIINPATGHVLATVAEGDSGDFDQAVRAARQALDAGALGSSARSGPGKAPVQAGSAHRRTKGG